MLTNYAIKAIVGFLLLSSTTTYAAVQINEVMPCNLSTIINTDNYNFSGYIEFSNNEMKDVNLKGHTLIHFKKGSNKYSEKWRWEIKEDLQIKGNAFTMVWADESSKKNHVPYKLDADGGYLLLKNGDVLIDSFAYGKQTPHLSYGRFETGTGYMEPTPAEANTVAYAKMSRCQPPVFSEKGGLKDSPFTLSLSCPTEGATIYYTTDGSEPTLSSKVYDTEIAITKNTNIRAKACAEGILPSTIVTSSYIYGGLDHEDCGGITLPVVSITVDDRYFNDNTIGMCVVGKNGIAGEKSCTSTKANYNQDWKRPINFEYFVDGEQVMSQEVEAAVEGGCSRSQPRKSLSLKASKKSGNDELGYHFFKEKPDLIHQTVHLRNGGTAYSKVKFRDGLTQTFATTMNIDYQAYQPVAYYINGKYTGLMALMERTNADYVKANYGLDDDEIDLVTISDQNGINASKGTLDAWNEMLKYITTADNKSSEYYEEACKRMDMDEYIDYQVLEQFVANIDWPGNNTKLWRERKEGSRFRWILFDTDYGLGFMSNIGPTDRNMINWCKGVGGTSWGNSKPWMTEFFAHISENDQFSRKFTTKFLIHLSTTFSDEHIKSVMDSIATLVESEYCADIHKSSKEHVKELQKYAIERSPYILKHLKAYAETGDAADLELNANIAGVRFTINGETVNGFKGKYLTEFPTDIKAYPPVGYKFDHWEIEGDFDASSKNKECANNLPGELNGSLLKSCVITAIFTTGEPINTLVINELCASSNELSKNADKYGKYPDWIEVYNFGTEPVDLAGLFFSNKQSNLQLSQIAYGDSSTIVKGNSHKIIWANSNPVDGALYLNFNMNIDKAKTIYLSDAAGNLISQAAYEPHETNESYGYQTDNAGEWVIFDICENKTKATPGKANGTIDCNSTDAPLVDNFVEIYPNPSFNNVTVTAESTIRAISIFDLNGRLLKFFTPNGNEQTIDLSSMQKGVYVIKVVNEEGVYNEKLIKQ